MLVACATVEPVQPKGWAYVQYDRCKAGDDAMCFDLLMSRDMFSESFKPKAMEAGEIACRRDHFRSCHVLLRGIKDPEQRLAAHQDLCMRGDNDSCVDALQAMVAADADPADRVRYGFKACETDPTHSLCEAPLRAMTSGAWSPSADERQRALKLGLCGSNRPYGLPRDLPMTCDSILGMTYMGAVPAYKDTLVDYPGATEHFRAACDGGDVFGCGRLGLNLLTGTGVDRNVDEGLQRLEHACEAQDVPACYGLALARLETKGAVSADGATAAFTKACGPNAYCYVSAATILAHHRKRKHALELAESGCAMGSTGGCTVAGRLRILMRHKSNPHIAALVDSCRHGRERSCRALSFAYRKGIGVKRNAKAARGYYNAAEDETFRAKWLASLERSATDEAKPIDHVNVWVSITMPYTLPVLALAKPDRRWGFSRAGYRKLSAGPPFRLMFYDMPLRHQSMPSTDDAGDAEGPNDSDGIDRDR